MKLRLLTILFLIIYALSFTSHIKDFNEGFKDGNNSALHGTKIYSLKVEIPNKEGEVVIKPNANTFITKGESTEKVKIETTDKHPNYLSIPIGILMFVFTLLIPIMFIILYKFFKDLYKGSIVNNNQIKRLRFLGYAHLAYAIIENILIWCSNLYDQKIAAYYNLTLSKQEYNFSLFFIPLILLMIVEVLKQHLRLKEDADLTI
ncbi:DUF2975 domain-containing protein [Myroides odoratimimus]|uniref:DUF2975 domain-containing protein n=1 Tax=Myroides odoratimimus TaxID=76832 RepID=UPI002576E357|nr:DUF2975 domain-containing protein [Myroides odoratimimus]MDM1397623.1 DUF2975 domain-containing protein [Myroides odoratimimus]